MVCSGVCIGNKDLIIDIPPSHIGMEMSKKKKKTLTQITNLVGM